MSVEDPNMLVRPTCSGIIFAEVSNNQLMKKLEQIEKLLTKKKLLNIDWSRLNPFRFKIVEKTYLKRLEDFYYD